MDRAMSNAFGSHFTFFPTFFDTSVSPNISSSKSASDHYSYNTLLCWTPRKVFLPFLFSHGFLWNGSPCFLNSCLFSSCRTGQPSKSPLHCNQHRLSLQHCSRSSHPHSSYTSGFCRVRLELRNEHDLGYQFEDIYLKKFQYSIFQIRRKHFQSLNL